MNLTDLVNKSVDRFCPIKNSCFSFFVFIKILKIIIVEPVDIVGEKPESVGNNGDNIAFYVINILSTRPIGLWLVRKDSSTYPQNFFKQHKHSY